MDHKWRIADRTLRIGRRPLLMGIVNVTPDSFSDGGQHFGVSQAVAHGLQLIADGADLLDIGGESTRPGSAAVPVAEELRRIEPVIAGLARQTSVPLSIDTSKAAVARAACTAGATIINDVTALTGDPAMLAVAQETGAGLVLMHMQGTPATMQLAPQYRDVVREVGDYLQQRLAAIELAGIEAERTLLDPGIGFGKRQEHNLALLRNLDMVRRGQRPICLGVSRKGFINRVLGKPGPVEQGDAGTVGVVLQAVSRNAAQVLRVHNVRQVNDALTLFQATACETGPGG